MRAGRSVIGAASTKERRFRQFRIADDPLGDYENAFSGPIVSRM